MGYKQNNNPFNRKISSPLRHNVRDKQGSPWVHQHDGPNVTGRVAGNVIQGDSNFGGKFKDKKVKGVTETDAAMAYANQIANNYNTGALVGGNFRADDYDKWKGYNRGGSKPKSFLGKLTGIDIYRSNNDGRVNVDFGKRSKGFSGSNQWNVQQGEWDGETGAWKNAPTEQVTPDQVYEMMVEGGGMVSIVDGKIVAGNPNEDTIFRDFRSDQGKTNSGMNAIPSGYEYISPPKEMISVSYDNHGNRVSPGSSRTSKIERVANPDYEAQMAEYNKFYDQRSDSPLNQGHETDERSNQTFNLQEGYDYQDPVVTVTEGEWVDDPNNPGQQMRVITTDESITGSPQISGKTNNPGPMSGNWLALKEGICNGTIPGNTNICDDTQNISNSVTEYRPIENGSTTETEEEITTEVVEENLIPPPSLDLGVPGSIKSRGGSFKLPSVDVSELIKLPQGWFEPKSAGGGRGCGCMVNPR